MDYKKCILDMLLDKYEESRHYTGDAKVNRRITLVFDKKSFPQYDIESTETKDTIHYSLYYLEKKDIITIQWFKFEAGNIVDRVFLNVDSVDNAYFETDRKPKKDTVSDVLSKLGDLKKNSKLDWMIVFLEIQIKEIDEKKKLTRYIPGDDNLLNLLLTTLKALDDKGNEEMLERVFSKKYLGGSKIFEKSVRSRLCTILREFFPDSRDVEDEEILQQAGIIKTMEELLFFGPLKIQLFDNKIDFAPFCFGASMNTGMINSFEVLDLNVNKVITIENKANYLEYIKKYTPHKTLAVYLGGFYSPVKRVFLKKIYDYIKLKDTKTQFFHWGDIDLGGFNIFMQLKSRIIYDLNPLFMDVETLQKYENSGEIFDQYYGRKLEKLLQKEEYSPFFDVIKEMLKLGIKLEQEALL